jgi:hypothetical protein
MPAASAAACDAAPSKRVHFAPGPLPDTPDGHPAREGRVAAPRPTSWLVAALKPVPLVAADPLTPANIRMLAAELGPLNAPSIGRLKRRVGLVPPLVRPPPPGKEMG